MATATLTSTPTTIDNAEAVTNWGGDTFALNGTAGIEGSNCVECAQTTNGNNDAYVTGTWDFSGGGLGDQHLRLWFNFTYFENFSATNPIQVFLYDGTNTAYYYWDKGTSYQGGWSQAVIYTGDSPDSGSVTKSSITRIGVRVVTASKPRNVPFNALFDAWKYGDGYTVTGGTSGDPMTWADIATTDLTSAYGIVTDNEGVYNLRGDIQIGDGTSTTYFEPSGELAVFTSEQINTGLYNITFFDDASLVTNINISGGAISGPGTALTRFTVDASATCNAFDIDGLQLSKSGAVDFHAAASITNTSFNDCYQIDPSTGTFENNTVSNYSEAAVNGSLLWPGGTTVKDCSFINCDEAIEITQTSNQTFDNLQFSTNTDDVHLNNGGNNIDVSKTNGSNPTSQVSTGGGTVNYVGASVTTSVTVKDADDGSLLSGARVLVYVTSGVNFPFEASISITGAGTTATVTHTAHGLGTGDNVMIAGVAEDVYNGAYDITVTGVNTYTYTTNETISISPATGTPVSTFCFINAETTGTGVLSDTRVVNSDQPVGYRVRKASISPFYKGAKGSDTVSSASGTSITANLVLDE